jgi:AcrR family transcriptional regulator
VLGEAIDRAAEAPEGREGLDRRSRRRAATRAEILDAAWTLARTDGLTNFSMRDVATKVGMRAPSLYQYFDSKHAMYDAMFGQAAQASLETVCADLPASVDRADARAVLLELATRVFEFATSDPARMQLLFQRTIPGFEPSPSNYAPSVEMSTTIQAVFIDLGFTDPDAMDLFTAMVSGLLNQQMSNDPGGTRWARLLGRTVDMFIDEMSRSSSDRRPQAAGSKARQTARRSRMSNGSTGNGNKSSTRSKVSTRTTTTRSTDKKRGR